MESTFAAAPSSDFGGWPIQILGFAWKSVRFLLYVRGLPADLRELGLSDRKIRRVDKIDGRTDPIDLEVLDVFDKCAIALLGFVSLENGLFYLEVVAHGIRKSNIKDLKYIFL